MSIYGNNCLVTSILLPIQAEAIRSTLENGLASEQQQQAAGQHDHEWAARKFQLAKAKIGALAALTPFRITQETGEAAYLRTLERACLEEGYGMAEYTFVVGLWTQDGPMNIKAVPARDAYDGSTTGALVSGVRRGMPPAITKGCILATVNQTICVGWSYEDIMAALRKTPRPLQVTFLSPKRGPSPQQASGGTDNGEGFIDYPETEWASLAVTWNKPGSLALKLTHERLGEEPPLFGVKFGGKVTSVHKNMPSQLKPGAIVAAYRGESKEEVVLGWRYDDLLAKLKLGERPLTLIFLQQIDSTTHLTESQRISIQRGIRASLGEVEDTNLPRDLRGSVGPEFEFDGLDREPDRRGSMYISED